MRVAGIDPGTVSFDLCVMQDGEVVEQESLRSAQVADDPAMLVEALRRHGPFELILGPAGYGLPLVHARDVGDRELALMLLVRAGGGAGGGIGGMRALIEALIDAGLPVVFGPGVIHLVTVPAHRKWNRIDLGTADKVASAAACIADQMVRLALPSEQTSLVMLELGGAFSAALAVQDGQIVDGLGGSSGPIGVRAAGALDSEVAQLLGAELSKRTVFSGGALDPGGVLDLATPGALDALRADPAAAAGWTALEEGAAKAVLALTASAGSPREVLVSGRLAAAPGLLDAIGTRLRGVAPVLAAPGWATAARGSALIADGLAGGRHAPLVARLRLREASGTALDHLRVDGADRIRLA